MNDNLKRILEKSKLKKTVPRLSVLKVLASRKVATSEPYLEQKLGKDIDRVTLYRTLNTFEDKGIIHKVFDQNGVANYAMCSAECDVFHHKDEHLHFNCIICNKVYCLDKVNLPKLRLPKGFEVKDVSLTASGICEDCATQETNS